MLGQFVRGDCSWILGLGWTSVLYILPFVFPQLQDGILRAIMLCNSQDGGARANLDEPWVPGRWVGRDGQQRFDRDVEVCEPDHDCQSVTWQSFFIQGMVVLDQCFCGDQSIWNSLQFIFFPSLTDPVWPRRLVMKTLVCPVVNSLPCPSDHVPIYQPPLKKVAGYLKLVRWKISIS